MASDRSFVHDETRRRGAAIVALPRQWLEDQARYPLDLRSQVEAIAITRCAVQLDNVLAGRDRHDSGQPPPPPRRPWWRRWWPRR